MVYGDRIRRARELRAWTQTELARRTGLDQSAIARLEAGDFQPSNDALQAIARETDFPRGFFQLATITNLSFGTLQYRAHASTARRKRLQAYRFAEVSLEVATRLSQRIKRVINRIPRLSADPISAAESAREALGLSPTAPIPNLVNAMERAGAIILALPASFEGLDAFSTWTHCLGVERPVLAIATGRSGDRLRFSLAHDLGHLMMHHDTVGASKQKEAEASRFAAELLLPASSMRQEISTPVTLTTLAPMKPRWGASIQTLIRRARDLEIISPRQYTYLFEQVGMRGWRTSEPIFIPEERPRAVRKMVELIYGEPINIGKVANDLDLPQQLTREIMQNYAAHSGPRS